MRIDTVYSKTNNQLTLLATMRGAVPPLVSTTVLVASTKLLDVRFTGAYVALALVSALLCWIGMGRDQHDRVGIPARVLPTAGQALIEWAAVVVTLLLIGYATKTSASFSRRALFLWFGVTPFPMTAALAVLHAWTRYIAAASRNLGKAVIVGENRMSAKIAGVIANRPEFGLTLERVFRAEECLAPREADLLRADERPGRGCGSADVRDYVNGRHIDVVFIALPVEHDLTHAILDDLRDTTSSVYLVPDLSVYDLIQARSDEIEGIPVIALCESPLQGMRGLSKRVTDVVLASLLLAIGLPAMSVIAAAIRFTSPGPIIFRQHRYGLDGERITVYKFRTMTVTEDGPRVRQARRNDPRVTSVGRFLRRTSLDELPQLLNVLSGQMSLVGPRPHAVAHNEQYRKLIKGYMVRHKVVPGITGLAQVNGCRGATPTVEEMRRRVEYDLEYLRRWCWVLDLKILFKTLALVIRDKRAY